MAFLRRGVQFSSDGVQRFDRHVGASMPTNVDGEDEPRWDVPLRRRQRRQPLVTDRERKEGFRDLARCNPDEKGSVIIDNVKRFAGRRYRIVDEPLEAGNAYSRVVLFVKKDEGEITAGDRIRASRINIDESGMNVSFAFRNEDDVLSRYLKEMYGIVIKPKPGDLIFREKIFGEGDLVLHIKSVMDKDYPLFSSLEKIDDYDRDLKSIVERLSVGGLGIRNVVEREGEE